MPSLFVVRGNDQGHRWELTDPVVGLGRDSTNPIRLHDTEVSRRHAEIRITADACLLVDLGSSNGSFVNGQRVERHELTSGDRVQLGSTLLLFTGDNEQNISGLDERVDIVIGGQPARDASRIVHSITHEEGSRIFNPRADLVEHPGVARIRSNLEVMYGTALAISRTADIDQLLGRIMQLIFEWVEADRGCIMLLNNETGRLEVKASRLRRSTRSGAKLTISKTILDYVLEHNEGVLTSDAQEDQRWNPAASIVQLGIREAICVPMQGRYDRVGVIYIDTSTPPERLIRQEGSANRFNQDHLKLLIAIAHQAALAVEDTRYYSAMVQAERLAAVGQTIAMLSHHIKNILQGIRGGSYLIEQGLANHDENVVARGWKIVDKNQAKISTLVMDMLTFSKEREPELAPADLNEVTADVVELMQSRAADMQVTLHWHPGERMPICTFDPEGMHRAILNVVTNAIDAAADIEDRPGEVHVRTHYLPATDQESGEEDLLTVTVEDNGAGISDEDREAIFNLFVSSKGGRGTGLGLPVSNKILQEHGGCIRVQGTTGIGSTFVLQLPATKPDNIGATLHS